MKMEGLVCPFVRENKLDAQFDKACPDVLNAETTEGIHQPSQSYGWHSAVAAEKYSNWLSSAALFDDLNLKDLCG